jgi:ribonuclease P protein component
MAEARRNTLGSGERLKHRKQIDQLFAEGKAFSVGALRVMWRVEKTEEESTVRAGFTVSKRHFKKAVARNRIKRLLRELYRTQKQVLFEKPFGGTLFVFFIFTGKEMPSLSGLQPCMQKAMEKLVDHV